MVFPWFSHFFSHDFAWDWASKLRMVDTAVDTAAGHGARMKLAGPKITWEFLMGVIAGLIWLIYGYYMGL